MRMPIPDAIQNAPQLELGLELYLDAFFELSSEREVAWGPGPIGWLAVEQYARANSYDEDQVRLAHFFTGKLDRAYRQYHERKRPKTKPKKERSRGG